MKIIVTFVALMFATVTLAEAKGCLKGAITGGIAGHYAHHTITGAIAGCYMGHHIAHQRQQQVTPTQGQGTGN